MKKQMVSLLTAASILSPAAMAASQNAPLNTGIFRVEGEANLDYFAKDSQSYETNLRVQDARVRLTAQIGRHVKAVLTTQLERMLIDNGVEVGSGVFDIERFVEEAYIEFVRNEDTGMPMAVIIGKHAIAFGQQASRLPMFRDNLMFDLTRHEQVIGITVRLDQKWFNRVLGSLEVSVFDNTQHDLKLGDAAGMSIRLSREITRNLKATASAMAIAKDDNYDWDDAEKRLALGVVYATETGWKAYAEGVWFENNAKYPTSNWGVTVGGAKQVGRGEVVIEFTYLDNVAYEFAAAYNLAITRNLIVSPEVRHIRYDGGGEDTRVGVRTKVRFDSAEQGGRKN